MNPRLTAVRALTAVIDKGASLGDALPRAGLEALSGADRALAQAIAYGVLRQYHWLDFCLTQLLAKPLKERDADIRCLLLCGIYQLAHMRVPDHAAVAATVETVRALKKPWASGLVNGVLRNYQRRVPELAREAQAQAEACHAHPGWLLEALQASWPNSWQDIVAANNRQPPMTLRVNIQRTNRDRYLAQLAEAGIEGKPAAHGECALALVAPVGVDALPGFTDGLVSVQDAAAQLAAPLLDAHPGERVLDACAAPGGKTGHILESYAELAELVALDVDPARLMQVQANLQRLGLGATLREGDACTPADWWDGTPFDRILLDAPCTATGVIRRHPDIKLLRRAGDVEALAVQQGAMLEDLWPLLRPGGILLYSTCSVLPVENSRQIQEFLSRQPDACPDTLAVSWGRALAAGRQILPGEDDMDGFYYAHLAKN
ncbi:MAG: 16S rRNA (cytosine(967)-C(5))-methyltransferase RsmB [Pseudomonadota bacterium]|nr:MAG: 16S rRNA (cytosine(967)-C(5))-methyltransferase RsmB [Pseudomonadota bacterium]